MGLKIYFEDEFKIVEDITSFQHTHVPVTAAGGVVINDKGEILFIYRREKWDLPKGKMEADETPEICAAREVAEETGLQKLVLQQFLITTYHTYQEKGKNILKDTHWFLFSAPGNQTLVPQQEEQISEIEWVSTDKLQEYTRNTYSLIKDVLMAADFRA